MFIVIGTVVVFALAGFAAGLKLDDYVRSASAVEEMNDAVSDSKTEVDN
jgi:hypothetical protein